MADTDHCNGGWTCPAVTHLHGCNSDKGDCDEPSEHVTPVDTHDPNWACDHPSGDPCTALHPHPECVWGPPPNLLREEILLLVDDPASIDDPTGQPWSLPMVADLAQERGEHEVADLVRRAVAVLRQLLLAAAPSTPAPETLHRPAAADEHPWTRSTCKSCGEPWPCAEGAAEIARHEAALDQSAAPSTHTPETGDER